MKGGNCMNLIISWIRKIIEFFKILHLIYRYGLDAILKDPLTKVYSKFLLEEYGEIEIRRAKRYGVSLCLTMFDLDNLKETNDKQGHDAGDEALVKVVCVFQEIFSRSTDMFFRTGGDEFIIILLDISQSGLQKLLKKIAEELDDLSLSASIGSCFWKEGMTLDELKKEADIKLYAEKNSKKKKPDAI